MQQSLTVEVQFFLYYMRAEINTRLPYPVTTWLRGVTYLATDTNLDHKVAIKEYMPGWAVERQEDNSLAPLNDESRKEFDLGVQSFLREARTLVKFRHPNIVRVMAVFEANNTAYLVMEYEEGEEFKSYVQRGWCCVLSMDWIRYISTAFCIVISNPSI